MPPTQWCWKPWTYSSSGAKEGCSICHATLCSGLVQFAARAQPFCALLTYLLGMPHLGITADVKPRASTTGRSLRRLSPTEKRWELASRVFPCIRWMRTYHRFPGGWRVRLARDVVAGLAVSFLIVPQGLSYAQVAGLPAQYGLCKSYYDPVHPHPVPLQTAHPPSCSPAARARPPNPATHC